MLKISKNRRYLVHADESPFFYLGDTAWELFHRLNREEADLFLTTRARQGFTVIQAVVLAELDGLHTPNPYGHIPLVGDDPTKPNEAYFEHVDAIVNKAQSLGLTIGMLPSWGDKWNKKWGVGPEIFNPANARAYGEWLARRYRDKPIIWILGGDRPPETPAHYEIVRAMAEGLRIGHDGRQLMTYHTWGQDSSAHYFHEDGWLDFNATQTGHVRDRQNWRFMSEDYSRTPTKPCTDLEPGYENMPNDLKDTEARMQDFHCRKFLYWALFAGAHGHTYGCNDVWQMFGPDKEPALCADLEWNKAIDLPGANQMHHAKDLLLARPYLTRIPDQSMIVSETYLGGDHIAATRDSEGSYALVYSAAGLPFTIDLSKLCRPVIAKWVNPRTGEATLIGEFESKGLRDFTPPTLGETQDWVLTLDA